MNKYEINHKLLKEGKDISELDCLYTFDEIKSKIKDMYPTMNNTEIEYHADNILNVDWLKVCNNENEFIEVIREQID
ncbi:hypothetical protein AAGG74_16080 [Bacillus mexicanus]|uniref:hypothetical protein n=1 Tax=Bacillus mexicanus TaxID=2834415 RepID=UPI003D1A9E96